MIFLEKRLIRIVPLYFLFTGIEYFLRVHKFGQLFIGLLAKSLLFVPFYNDLVARVQPLLVQGWTLNYEMFFYTAFALCLFFPCRRALAGLTAFFVALVAAGWMLENGDVRQNILLSFYTSPIILLFVTGAGLGYLHREWIRPGLNIQGVGCGQLILLACALAVAALGYRLALPHTQPMPWDGVIMACGAIASVAACLWEKERVLSLSSKAWVVIGDASYSLYLSHGFIVTFAFKALVKFNQQVSVAAFVLIVCLIAIPFGILINRMIEVPMTNWLRRRAHLAHRNQAFIG